MARKHRTRTRTLRSGKGREVIQILGPNYKHRARKQAADCKDGKHRHNTYENECCPCFGCCVPELRD